jgi:integrase
MARKLTDKSIAALKAKAARYEVWAEGVGGFGVRVSPNGTKSFVWLYHWQGAPRRLTLGNYPAMTLADAHVALGQAKQALERGEDPGKKAVEERQAERKAETVDQLVDDYLDRHARPNKSPASAAEDERILKREVLPHWRGRKVKDIRRRDVIRVLDRIVDRGSPVMANRALACVRRMFRFAVHRDIIEQSPCSLIQRPHQEQARERNLDPAEVARAWAAIGAASMEVNLKRALKLMLVTAQRRGEVLGLHEREMDRASKLWTIPGERTKNGRPHIVPLSPLALEIIGDPTKKQGDDRAVVTLKPTDADTAQPAGRKPIDTGWIFPSPRTSAPYLGKSADHAVRDLFVPRERRKPKAGKVKEAKAPPLADMADRRFTPHDLRRTAATMMRELGVSRDDVKLVLNHADVSVTGRVYDKYRGLTEKQRALMLWADRLGRIIAGEQPASNVTELRVSA